MIVIETKEIGGTIHTIKFAEKQNRPLIFPNFSNEVNNPLIPKKLIGKGKFIFDQSLEGVKKFIDSQDFPKINETKPDDSSPQISMF